MSNISFSGQHTFGATLRFGLQKAGEGRLRLPFEPLHRRDADQARPASRYLGVFRQDGLGVISCG